MAILLLDFKVCNSKGVGYKSLHLAFKDFISRKVLFLWEHLKPIGFHHVFNLAIWEELQPTFLPMDPNLVLNA